MAGEIERAILSLVRDTLMIQEECKTPDWLLRPAEIECRNSWSVIQLIYQALTSRSLPHEMPPRERRKVDAVIRTAAGPRIVEVDETQHFNEYRAETLRLYPASTLLAFDSDAWIKKSSTKKRLEGGGFGRPCPPLFPDEGGRHRQRAFRDALCDLVPLEHGFLPTLRIAYFEVHGWLYSADARDRMRTLLAAKGVS